MINDEIREITRRFVEALHPEKVILFGYYAKDTEREDSDYDFFIVMSDETEKTKNMITVEQEAYRSLLGMKDRKSVDVLANTASRFIHNRVLPTIEREAARDGVVMYG